jgi:hypothetical protein
MVLHFGLVTVVEPPAPRYVMYKRLRGPQGQFGLCGKEKKNVLALPREKAWFFGYPIGEFTSTELQPIPAYK